MTINYYLLGFQYATSNYLPMPESSEWMFESDVGAHIGSGHSGLGVTSTSGILVRTESKLRFRWCEGLFMGGNTIPIDL